METFFGGFRGIRVLSGGVHRRVCDGSFLPHGLVGVLVDMDQRYVSRVRRLVSREYLREMKLSVFPLTKLPVELNLELEVEQDYFIATAAIGHPGFGYFGLAMRGLVLGILNYPLVIMVDFKKAYLYPVKVEDSRITLDTLGEPFSSTDIGTVALAANKLLFLNDIVLGDLSLVAENINRYLMSSLSGRI